MGTPWRDIPKRYGPWHPYHDRLARWERNGTWLRLFQSLQALANQAGKINWDGAVLGSSHIRAHSGAAGAKTCAAMNDARPKVKSE
ncbi:transposase [Deinococcus gobiensis]